MPTLKPSGRLGLVLHPRSDPTLVVEKLTNWARAHGKQLIADAREAARLPDDVERVSAAQLVDPAGRDRRRAGSARCGGTTVKLSLLDLPFLPEEMRDALPGGDSVALTLNR